MSPDGRLNSVGCRSRGAEFASSAPQPLFDLHLAGSPWLDPRQYAVAADGQRFLIVRRVEDAGPEALVVVLNWIAGLKKQ